MTSSLHKGSIIDSITRLSHLIHSVEHLMKKRNALKLVWRVSICTRRAGLDRWGALYKVRQKSQTHFTLKSLLSPQSY